MGIEFNKPLIIGDIDASVKADISQLQQDVGDLSQLETADKSNLVNALNEAMDSTLNGVNRDLTNLSDAGDEKLCSLTAYSNNGELLTDSEGLADVKSYAHSTYVGDQPDNTSPLDPKKFTYPAGHRPVITENGIASGFSSSNYLSLNLSDIFSKKNYKIKCPFVLKDTADGAILGSATSRFNLVHNYTNDVGHRVILFVDGIFNGVSYLGLTTNTNYDVIFERNNTQYKVTIVNKDTGAVVGTPKTATSENNVSATTVLFGYAGWYGAFKGSIDLKQFSITVDGVEVFSGNKTGIDTIKPVDFTAITSSASSPFVNPSLPFSDNGLTITEDGIASGFSSSNYLTKTINISGTIVKIREKFHIDTFTNSTLSDLYRSNYFVFLIGGQGYIPRARIGTDAENNWISGVDYTMQENKDYIIECVINTTTKFATLNLYDVNENLLGTKTNSSAFNSITLGSATAVLGAYPSQNRGFTNGSIDLNAFKIYVDGNLVYQPCLKIPYTESKTGSKIVDSIYRDRVNDMAEQFGYAPYYTLSDTDFTLPQCEIYGLIDKMTKRPDYYNVVTTGDISGSSNAYTFGFKSLAVIKPTNLVEALGNYSIVLREAYKTTDTSITGLGYTTLILDTGDTIYTDVNATVDVYKLV